MAETLNKDDHENAEDFGMLLIFLRLLIILTFFVVREYMLLLLHIRYRRLVNRAGTIIYVITIWGTKVAPNKLPMQNYMNAIA